MQTTSDGVLLVFHDAVLDRMTDGPGPISTSPPTRSRAPRRPRLVPTLAESARGASRLRFNIDLKSDGAVEPLAALVERTRSHDRICVGSF